MFFLPQGTLNVSSLGKESADTDPSGEGQSQTTSVASLYRHLAKRYPEAWRIKIRMPLQIALFISPICLFAPIMVTEMTLSQEELLLVRLDFALLSC